ncbi:dicarboxylate/amino acid:cation symporter [Fundicoccus culcitae]|uniref:Dicarboxylate/amino acid:cation symporter n=1 Tax=Fundicoccus culcitae TaxID=2969821 RepID=A0ABY5P988_9LACT|nr:dicarboxylate/amino acid:cation symporter [Fundicoccus culcitae]UUX35312.1 dicarboxylate/amino acid:cation symporter [Fundicoccus culcitae]
MKKYKLSLTTQIIIATIAGILFGALVGEWAHNLQFIGTIFIRLIQMSVVLLVMTSVITAIGNMGTENEDEAIGLKIGIRTFGWIIFCTLLAALLGFLLATWIRPGEGMVIEQAYSAEETVTIGFQETITNFVSTNIFASMSEGNMIQIIVFSVLFGVGLNQWTKSSKDNTLLKVLQHTNSVTLNIIQMVMKLAPIGIFALLADVAGTIGFSVVIPMMKYLGTLFIGVVIFMVFMIFFTSAICKLNPRLMPKKFVDMSLIALTTTSSAIAFPTALKDSKEKFGIREDVANFTMSIGMTSGSAGAAMSYVIMILFMQQASDVSLTWIQLVVGIFLAIMLTLGTITVPGGSAVVATFLASSLGLPVESIALIIGVDWFAGMFRTFLNVNNDVLVSLLVANSVDAIDRDIYNEVKTFEPQVK